MMKYGSGILAVWLTGLLCATLATLAQASSGDRLARFTEYAGAPVSSFHYSRVTGYETLADNTIAVWTGVNRVHLIKIRQPCPEFSYSPGISLDDSGAGTFTQRFDTVRFGKDRCMVEWIRPVDYKAMREAAAKQP